MQRRIMLCVHLLFCYTKTEKNAVHDFKKNYTLDRYIDKLVSNVFCRCYSFKQYCLGNSISLCILILFCYLNSFAAIKDII